MASPGPAPTVVTDVLYTPELLEMILLNLDMETLLVSGTRINKTWASCIRTSQPLQRHLFFRATPPHAVTHPIPNPLLVKAFGAAFFSLDTTCLPARRHTPVFRGDAFLRLPFSPEKLGKAHGPLGSRTGLAAEVAGGRVECFTRRGASWRRMLVSQPPPRALKCVWLDMQRRGGRCVSWAPLLPVCSQDKNKTDPSSEGVCMGMLYDLVLQRTLSGRRYGVWFKMNWERPRSWFVSEASRRVVEALMEKEKAGGQHPELVVEFYGRARDGEWQVAPWRPREVREVYRSEDFEKVTTRGRVHRVMGEAGDYAVLDLPSCVTWTRPPKYA